MKSGYCECGEHDACSVTVRRASGKKYRCSCECHPAPNQKKVRVDNQVDEDED